MERSQKSQRGIVTLDVIWIVVLLVLAVALSLRGIGLVDKRENAGRLKRELVAVGEAVEKLAAEQGLEAGAEVAFADYAGYLDKERTPKRLREDGKDPLGGNYGTQVVGQPAVPDQSSVEALGKFWDSGGASGFQAR